MQILYKIQEISAIPEEIMDPTPAAPLKTDTLRCSLNKNRGKKCIYVSDVYCVYIYIYFKYTIFSVIKRRESQKGFHTLDIAHR